MTPPARHCGSGKYQQSANITHFRAYHDVVIRIKMHYLCGPSQETWTDCRYTQKSYIRSRHDESLLYDAHLHGLLLLDFWCSLVVVLWRASEARGSLCGRMPKRPTWFIHHGRKTFESRLQNHHLPSRVLACILIGDLLGQAGTDQGKKTKVKDRRGCDERHGKENENKRREKRESEHKL